MSVTVREYYSKRLKKKIFGYEVDITLQHKRIFKSKRGFLTKTEAREAGKTVELKLKKKTKQGYNIEDVINKDKNKITVHELMDLWLNAKKSTVTYSTYKFYECFVSKIKKDLGSIKAKSLKPENIELKINTLLDNISSTTASDYYTVLNIAYNWAITRGYVIQNPCNLVQKPKRIKKEMHVYNNDQLNKLLDAIKDKTIFVPVMLAATTGMRLGEICGLKWQNVNLDSGFIELKHQLQEEDKSLKLVPLKTLSSQRKIVLLDYTIKELEKLKLQQDANKNYLGDNYHDKDFVVCQNNGLPYHPTYISRNYRRILKDTKHKVKINGKIAKLSLYEMLDIPLIRFHDLRHTHATFLLSQNVNPKIVSERLGHSSIKTTLDIYAHVLPGMQKQAINNLNKKFPPKE
ncbi:site-specific integrase [Clostridium sp. AWRP]|uniref:tyrosine-type recombinase/integrase n=1 Tax=Clostridium sp. AWRP TaxID=2212991 RepID=UPI000FDC9226|nr:site-specific integrase [Clostridium sp. AWRP]AZV58950.1 site-specific integrase [Clostridium sp. AWRP]